MTVENDNILLSGAIAEQAALYDHLASIRELRLPLLSVMRVEPNLEEVFMHLIEKGVQDDHHETFALSHA